MTHAISNVQHEQEQEHARAMAIWFHVVQQAAGTSSSRVFATARHNRKNTGVVVVRLSASSDLSSRQHLAHKGQLRRCEMRVVVLCECARLRGGGGVS